MVDGALPAGVDGGAVHRRERSGEDDLELAMGTVRGAADGALAR